MIDGRRFFGLPCLAFLWLLLLLTSAAARDENKRQILVLHSYHKGLGWTDSISRGIEARLKASPFTVDLHYTFMDTKRVSSTDYLAALQKLYSLKYRNRQFDVIIASDDHAFRFLLDHHDTLFPGLPVVFCGVNLFLDDMIRGRPHITGVVEAFGMDETIHAALAVDPGIRRIVSIVDATMTGRANRKRLQEIMPRYKDRLEFHFLGDADMAEVKKHVANLPSDSVALLLHFTSDASGNRFSLEESADILTAACNRPVFSFWDFHLNHGIVGGMITSGQAHGETAAELALRILDGERPSDIPVIKKNPNRYIFDYVAMKRFGIAPRDLPQGSRIINRPVSLYAQHKILFLQILGGAGVLGLLVVFLAGSTFRRRRAEGQLKESEEKFRTMVEATSDWIWEVDAEGRYRYASPKIRDLLGYAPHEIIGMTPFDLMPPEESRRVMQFFSETLALGNPINGFENRNLHKDGYEVVLETSAAPVLDADGKVTGYRGIDRDVSERKRLEDQVQRAQRLESLSTLAGGIAHDFNNLLMGIQGRTSLILMEAEKGTSQFDHLKGIEDHVQSAADLTRQLLGFARGGKYEVKPIDPNTLVKRTADVFVRTRPELVIHEHYGEAIRPVAVDRNQMDRVVLNILVNAWQAMPAGGDIFVATTEVVLADDEARRLDVAPGRFVRIDITDTGTGMDAETLSRVFDPFFTTKTLHRGSGLGLASAYGVVRNHNGTIDVSSQVGKGSTFSVYLPATDRTPAVEAKTESVVETGNETVLLVDDEALVVDVGAQLLRGLGYRVITATGGREAVSRYAQDPTAIDLVILDMIMPDMDGGETFDRLKEIDDGVRVLLSSGYSIDRQAKEILDRGCAGFLQKPFGIQKLARSVRTALEKGPSAFAATALFHQ